MSANHRMIKGQLHDLGDGVIVRRMLPSMQQRAVGPFVFLDHIGPFEMAPSKGIDVRPHPHIGLSTMTYLFDGALGHRDSLGYVQDILPGEVNWMTAGSGIVHSERTPDAQRRHGHRMHGLQFWVGLPADLAEMAPGFSHCGARELPHWSLESGSGHCRLIAGDLVGRQSPVPVHSRLFCLDVNLVSGASFHVPNEHAERAIQLVEGEAQADGVELNCETLLVLEAKSDVHVTARSNSRLVVFGGDPLDGPRFVWWNFVATTRERIEQAAQDWEQGKFATVPGETEFIPVPPRKP